MHIILASQSPRRRELLERMGIRSFQVIPAQGDESISPELPPDQQVEELSRRKAREVTALSGPDALVIAADTVVAVDGRVLGKPHSTQEAHRMLSLLSGRTHRVYTGLTVCRGKMQRTVSELTEVRFRPLSQEQITAYVATGEPMDKAGSYGIQGLGCVLVEGIVGDYYNVMGLPVCRLALLLQEFGIELPGQE